MIDEIFCHFLASQWQGLQKINLISGEATDYDCAP